MPGTIPKLMNAVWYKVNGEAADVLVHGEMPVPQPAAGEVLVHLGASGVNPSDVKARAGSRPIRQTGSAAPGPPARHNPRG